MTKSGGRVEGATGAVGAVLAELQGTFTGEIRADRLYRALYATDASIYQIVPDAVLLPRSVQDVQAAVRACSRHGVPITPRGAGTGLTGGAVNHGLQLDCSRFLNNVLSIDPRGCLAVVQPGVVLDELNAVVKKHGLHFAPDVAPSSRATIGGMIANNSCGAHSVLYGRTVDHLAALRVVLADGSDVWWGEPAAIAAAGGTKAEPALLVHCEEVLQDVVREYAADIDARFPKILRSNGGYGLDRLRVDDGRINVEAMLCGSEGTLGIVVEAVLKLEPLPKYKGLVIAHYQELLDALSATPVALEHSPAAVELLDKLIINAARASTGLSREIELIEGNPHGVLVIELFDDTPDRVMSRMQRMVDDLSRRSKSYSSKIVADEARQSQVWNVRKAGLGLLMSRPGERHPYDFVDDTAVDPSRLREYIARFMQVLREEGVEDSSYYAHASVGCLHVKPVLNLRRLEDVRRMHRVADRISSLALEFNGSNTGEHGDGIVRSEWIAKMFGLRLVEAFRRVKAAFDPQGILNPGKIVDPLPMTENLRWRPVDDHGIGQCATAPLTVLDFSSHKNMLGLAEMCSGVGQCRQKFVGTMCPSYVATGDEMHTTRARANALRMALSDKSLLNGLDDPALDEVMDLCLSCKACKTECPTGVDMAKLKAEWQHRRNERRGVPLRSRFVALLPTIGPLACEFAPLVNAVTQSKWGRAMADSLFGFDRRVPLPKFARRTFRDWFAKRGLAPQISGLKTQVCLFVDTWTNCFAPEIGIAAVRVLEAVGCNVIVPETACCGRPAISKGLLDSARELAEKNVTALEPLARAGVPIVSLEPSCVSAMLDEWPQLVRTDAARAVAASAMMLESLLARPPFIDALARIALSPSANAKRPDLLLHGHCHQKALVGTSDAMTVLRAVSVANEINSGCCGMAGSFGHETEHYDVARASGENRLFPAIRSRGEASIVASGFSCRHQIEHHTGVRVVHPIERIAAMIPD
ncbi:MAG: FAD-binding protein [Planctomycetes bacterium]|nr:FAD-binding protein [Planctomycetota bacterium]